MIRIAAIPLNLETDSWNPKIRSTIRGRVTGKDLYVRGWHTLGKVGYLVYL